MSREEFLARLGVSAVGCPVILGVSHLVGHPMPWWLALLASLALVFLGEWIISG